MWQGFYYKYHQSLVCFYMLETFLQVRSMEDGPLLCHLRGTFLPSYQFLTLIHKTLTFLGIEAKHLKRRKKSCFTHVHVGHN